MKTLEELSDIDTTHLTDILPKIILKAVETSARARRFGRELVKINRDLVGKPGRSIHIPCRGSIVAAHVDEGCAVPEGAQDRANYRTQEITPEKTAVMVKITQEAMDATQFDLVKDHILEAGEAMADLEDLDIIDCLTGKTIKVEEETHKLLMEYGNKGETFDEIIRRLIKNE